MGTLPTVRMVSRRDPTDSIVVNAHEAHLYSERYRPEGPTQDPVGTVYPVATTEAKKRGRPKAAGPEE